MDILNCHIDTTVICALISLVGVVASVVVSALTARSTAAKEIEKLKISLSHDDDVAEDEAFSGMARAVAEYAAHGDFNLKNRAAVAVAGLRAQTSGELSVSLDKLYAAISGNAPLKTVDEALNEVLDKRRSEKNHPNRKRH